MRPTLFGYGKTTKAIAKLLGGNCIFFDDNCQEPYTDANNNQILPSSMFDPDKSKLEVTTPSLPPHHPLIQKAKNLISEYDYFLENFNGSCPSTHYPLPTTHSKPFTIWISGTNGKTTTTQMLTHLLAKRGAVSGGNIGTPLAELDPHAPIWVLESSSFTLHHTKYTSPDIYLLLPITPDHLDWHKSWDQYEADKLRPLKTMKEGELALVPKGLKLPKTDAWVVEYDNNEFLEEFFRLDASKLRYRAAFLQDALLALAISRTLFDEVDYGLMNDFVMDRHRQEEIKDHLGRLWVNDSKATNIDAAIQAIGCYNNKKIHLILGGDDKGVDLDELISLVSHKDITIYTVGSNNDKLVSMAKDKKIPYYSCRTIENAVIEIDKHLKLDQVALLSPAASSLDQFESYAKRGDTFIETVQNLSNS